MCKARRSNRAFSTRPIPREMLEQIIEAAHRAPTATSTLHAGNRSQATGRDQSLHAKRV